MGLNLVGKVEAVIKGLVQKDKYMVAEDRRMKLAGYDLYRFGGYELIYGNADNIIEDFFRGLFVKYDIRRS